MPILRAALARVLRDENAPVSLFDDDGFRDALLKALNPAVSVERYSRQWRLSQPTAEDEWVTGRLGFLEPTVTPGITYSEDAQDFIELEEEHAGGTFSNFAIHIPSQYIIFELKPQPNEIRPNSFVGALKAILQQDQFARLTAELIFDSAKLNEWLESVDKVSSIKISLRRPNPDYTGRPESIKRILEETNASKVRIEAESEEDGLDVQNSELHEYADYAEEGYGSISATGDREGRKSQFASSRNVPQPRIETGQDESRDSLLAKLKQAAQNFIANRKK